MAQVNINMKNKLNNEVQNLRKEVDLLRSLMISIVGRDKEGNYKPGFVKTILKAAKERPTHKFTDPSSLFVELKKI